MVDELRATGEFDTMTMGVDEVLYQLSCCTSPILELLAPSPTAQHHNLARHCRLLWGAGLTGLFCLLQAEHSMELHMPFIAYTLRGSSAKLVPILVGALTTDRSEPVLLAAANTVVQF